MKNTLSNLFLRACLLGVALLGAPSLFATVGFTITPAAISNTYSGTISLVVTGLVSGDTVVVQKFLDANANGVIDAGDTLWQQFNLTDGQAGMVIGGVTNINVPGDTDGTANGQITAKLNFQTDFSQTIAGNYLFKLSSPLGHFSPTTNSFVVTNFPYPQKFTGTLVSGVGNVPNAATLLFPATRDGNPIGGAVANNSGAYTLPAPAGTYFLVPFKNNFVADFETGPAVTLSNNATFNTNLSLIPTTETISGRFVDAGNSTIGLPGLLGSVQTQDKGLIGICFTDTNGNFTAGVNSNQWGISSPSAGFAFHGYLELQNKVQTNTMTGSVSGLTIALPKATALFYGTVEDNFGNPLLGEVAIETEDQTNNGNGTYQADGYTDTNGNYVAAALGGLGNNDTWQAQIDNGSSFPNYNFSQPQNGGVTLTNGQVVLQNFTAILATNHITGYVTFNGNPVAGVGVNANSTDANNYQTQATTGTNGFYSLNVANDNWSIGVNCQGNDGSLDSILGSGNYQCPCGYNVTISNNNAMTNIMVLPGGSGQIFGYLTDTSDDPISGVSVNLQNECGGQGYNPTTTDGSGYYSFNGVSYGTYDVSVDCGGLNSQGYQCVNDQNVTLSSSSVEQDFIADSNGSSSTLQIQTTSLPDGIVGGYYSQQLSASGGQPSYSWSLTPGSLLLPGGLSLSTGGLISGTPTNAPFGGTNYYFSMRVTDSQANTADQLLSLEIYPALTMATNALPNGTNGLAYSAQILVSGGDPYNSDGSSDGYGEGIVGFGSIPPGLHYSYGAITSSNEFFVISGMPTNSGTYPFTLSASDADLNEVQNNFSITILSSSLQITTTSLTNATVGVAYTNQLQGSGGTAPYTWTIANGSQPLTSALTLSTNGLISGVPAASGTNNFIVRLTDHNSVTVTRALTLIINSRLTLSSPSRSSSSQFQMLLNGVTGQNYTVQMSTNLGSASWSTLVVTNAPSSSFQIIDPHATNSYRYYRVLIGP